VSPSASKTFGNKFTVSGSTPNNCLYRSEQYDPDPGLYYLRARNYNPALCRKFPCARLKWP
jgi:RHS repeat-associated protein